MLRRSKILLNFRNHLPFLDDAVPYGRAFRVITANTPAAEAWVLRQARQRRGQVGDAAFTILTDLRRSPTPLTRPEAWPAARR